MLSGEDPQVHDFTWDWDNFLPEKGFITVPTAFSVARAAGQRTVAVVGKAKLQHLAPPGAVDSFVFASRGDRDVANEAIVQAGVGLRPALRPLPRPRLRRATPRAGCPPAYLAKVAEADEAVGRLLAALPAHTTVILTADHGEGPDHAADVPENMTVPWIVAGPRVARKRRDDRPREGHRHRGHRPVGARPQPARRLRRRGGAGAVHAPAP